MSQNSWHSVPRHLSLRILVAMSEDRLETGLPAGRMGGLNVGRRVSTQRAQTRIGRPPPLSQKARWYRAKVFTTSGTVPPGEERFRRPFLRVNFHPHLRRSVLPRCCSAAVGETARVSATWCSYDFPSGGGSDAENVERTFHFRRHKSVCARYSRARFSLLGSAAIEAACAWGHSARVQGISGGDIVSIASASGALRTVGSRVY